MDYENKLRELKMAFLEGVTLQSGVTVFRMMNVVQNIGRFYLLRLRQDAHGCGIQRNPLTWTTCPTPLALDTWRRRGAFWGPARLSSERFATFSMIPPRMHLKCASLSPLQVRASPPLRTRLLDCTTNNRDWARRTASFVVMSQSTSHKMYSALSHMTFLTTIWNSSPHFGGLWRTIEPFAHRYAFGASQAAHHWAQQEHQLHRTLDRRGGCCWWEWRSRRSPTTTRRPLTTIHWM